jgi:mycofactocin system glycosyltransferase
VVGVTRYRRDPSWQQPGDGRVVIAGSPLRLFRVSAGGAHVLAASLSGEHPDTEIVRRLLDRFVDAGALHPEHETGLFTAADVTVVMPVLGTAPAPPSGLRTVVVDDGSPTPIAPSDGFTLLRLDVNRGPAAARNAGLDHVTTALVAFVDADVVLPDGWLAPLLPHFADPRVALVAPRVRGAEGPGVLAGYERRHSPLDLGDEPARVSAGTRVSYVPAATVVCRVDALRAVGGFDAEMRVGEDVDLVWRLVAAGHRCRYEPASVVQHRPRASLGALLRQRVGYGRSAAPLARRHPGALSPARMSGWSAGVWALLALRRPWSAVALAGGTAVALHRKLRDVPTDAALLLALRGHLAAGRQLAKGVTRVWWPVALAVACVVPRLRLPLLAACLGPSLADAVRARSAQPLLDAPLLLADEAAYGTGVWAGAVARREPGPLVPDLSGWPPRGDG